MLYKYRWYYVAVICISFLSVSFFCDIQPGWIEIEALRDTEKQLTQTLMVLRPLAKQSHAVQPVTNDLSHAVANVYPRELDDLLALVQASGLTIKSVTQQSTPVVMPVGSEMIRLVASGDFSQVAGLLFSLGEKMRGVLLTDFTYKAEQPNIFIINMTLLLWQGSSQSSVRRRDLKTMLLGHGPFCFSDRAVTQEGGFEQLQRTPLEKIRMIGYLKEGSRMNAVVSLPSGVLVDVNLGSIMGREHGRVVDIQQNGLLVSIDGGRLGIIKIRKMT